jgi:excisionase family DNA binding protein
MNEQPPDSTDPRANRPMMTLNEVADYLRVHRITIYRAIRAGDDLGQLKIGRVWRFSRESIVRFADGEEATVKTREKPRVGSSGLALRFGHGSSKDGSTR